MLEIYGIIVRQKSQKYVNYKKLSSVQKFIGFISSKF